MDLAGAGAMFGMFLLGLLFGFVAGRMRSE